MKNYYRITRFAIAVLSLFALSNSGNAQIIRTVAGNGKQGFTSDGGLADTTTLNTPGGLATDKAGNIYFADINNYRIREIVKATGQIITVAGDGAAGYNGDGGPASATSVQMQPNAVAVDTAGNLYISDAGNYRIREIVKSTGIINTIIGAGYAGYGGDGMTYGASASTINSVSSIAVDDSGNVYVADYNNGRIRKYYASTTVIATIAGNGNNVYYNDGGMADTTSLAGPIAVALDKNRNLYIAENSDSRIRMINASTGIISTVAGNGTSAYSGNGGPATAASLNTPNAICIDTNTGNMYISDVANYVIRMVNGKTDTITTVAGLGYNSYSGDGFEATTAGISNSVGVSTDNSGNVYIADQGNERIRQIYNAGPKITAQPNAGNGCINSSATITVMAKGTGITYQWQVDTSSKWVTLVNSTSYTGVTTATLNITNNPVAYQNNAYRCVISGIDTSSATNLFINPLPPIVLTVPKDSICPGVPTQLTAEAGGGSIIRPRGHQPVVVGPYGLSVWNTGDSTYTITVSPVVTTTYSVAVTQYGCTADTTITVNVDRTKINPLAFPTSSTCAGNSISLNGQGGNGSYSWSGGVTNGQSFTPLASKTYTVQSIDEIGCKITDSIHVTVNTIPVITVTTSPNDTICYGSQETLTASGAVTYVWSKGITNNVPFTPTSSGIYAVSGTDANGCVGASHAAITVLPLPIITGAVSPSAVCAGSSVTLSGNGGVSYTWSNGVTNGVPFVPVSSATYSVTGTDKYGCVNNTSVSVTVDPLPAIKASAFPAATMCQGSSLALFGSGGSSYAWSGGVNNGVSFTPGASHTYTVTGIDNNGCTNKDSITVTVHNKVVPTITSNNTSCGLQNGMASVVASNGIPPYSYNWSTNPAKSTASVDSLAAGTYVVSVSDSANCASTVAVSIAASTAPILTVSTTNSNCGLIGTGSAHVSVNGGTAPYHYMWNNGDTLTSDYNLKAATYIITVTDVNGCSTFAPAIVTNANGPKINTLSQVNVKCFGAATGAINVSVSGGTAPYLYLWSNGATTSSISSLYAGPYQLTVLDADSCTSVETFTIQQPHLPVAITSSSVKADCGVADGSASVGVTGGTAPYTYAWNNGVTTATDPSVISAIYSVIVTDGNGCIDSAHVSVSDKTGPALVLSLSSNATCGAGGLLSVSATGPNTPFTYAWSNGATTTAISDIPAGNYHVTVKDAHGCVSTADTSVVELIPAPITLCMVTVDPISNKHNNIIWNKTSAKQIASYNIYKESTQAGVYFKIANRPATDTTTFVDTLSDPTVRSWRYKISQVDSCGNESPLSPDHKTMHLTVNLGLGNNINLIWDNYEGLNFSTYYVYRDTNVSTFTLIDSIPNNIFTYTDNKPLNTKKMVLYRIGISNPGGCNPGARALAVNYNASKSNTGSITFIPALSVNNITSALNSLLIFPNPSTGVVTFEMTLPNNAMDLSLSVINTLGQEVMTQEFSRVAGQFSKQVDLSSLAKGVYFAKFTYGNSTVYKKVALQ